MWMGPEVAADRLVLVNETSTERRAMGLGDLDGLLAPWRVRVRRMAHWRDSLERIEHGGVDLAVLATDVPGPEPLNVLTMIRSRDHELPCVVVTPDTGIAVLSRALELRAYSVIRQPANARMLAGMLLRILRKR